MLTESKNIPKIRKIQIFRGPKPQKNATWPYILELAPDCQLHEIPEFRIYRKIARQISRKHVLNKYRQYSWIYSDRKNMAIRSDTTHFRELKNRLSAIFSPFLHGYSSDWYQRTRNKISFPTTPRPHRCVLWEPRYLKLKTNRPPGGSAQKSISGLRNCSVIP